MFSKFFINRPIFATVLALLIVVAGLVTLGILPIAQYPDIKVVTLSTCSTSGETYRFVVHGVRVDEH